MRMYVQHARTAGAISSGSIAGRWCRCALLASVIFAFLTPWACAQSLELHAAFNDVRDKMADDSQPATSEVRVAATPKPPAKTTKPAAQPVAQKNGAATTRVKQVPRPHPPIPADDSTEMLPVPAMAGSVPLAGSDASKGLQLTKNDKGLVTLIVRDKSLSQVLALIAQTQDLNIVASNDIDAMISITLRDVPIEEAMTAILSVANYTWVKRNNIIMITSLSDATNLSPDVQGRQVEVFDLDFASATVVADTVTKFLSPVGKVTVGASSPKDNKLTQERVVVEDLPDSLARISEYISQIDQPPRQVLIETHVLQIDLDDNTACGVDLNAFGLNGVLDSSGAVASLVPRVATNGLASVSASPAFVAKLGGKDLGAVIELLQKTTDAKTLGSPKVLVLNEQEARIQVGETIYFAQTTTTQTSTQQGAGSVETGVILRIRPRITRDGRVLLHVSPEVSTQDGDRQAADIPPNILKTTLETDVMLNDNQGMVIGGLINEVDQTNQSKIPYLGNVRGVGFLFRRSVVQKKRQELIVALVPRIQPYDKQYHDFEQGEIVKASVPLFHGPLCRTDRPWDAILPDGKRVSYPCIPKKRTEPPYGYYHDLGPRYEIPPTPLPHEELCESPCVLAPLPAGGAYPEEVLLTPPSAESASSGEIISDH
jgi:type IV pilus assembly protein PilQ